MSAQEVRSVTKTDWLLIALLIALVLPLRLWLLHNTEVTARDSIGYIRYALEFERGPWKQILVHNHQHPGYPFLVWIASMPVRCLAGETTPLNMELSAQLVSLFAALLLVVPMYFLGRQFFDRPICCGAALLYQYLPISAQHLSDGISEPAFLVVLTAALWQAVAAVRDRTIWRCGLCGLLTGTAYLIRPEGALVIPAFGFVLIALQYRADGRCPWKQFFACAAAMLLVAGFLGGIYMATTGRVTNKLSALEILKNLGALVFSLFHGHAAGQGHFPLFATSFTPNPSKSLRLMQSFWAVIQEVNQGFHYVASVPAALGLWWSLGKLGRRREFWVLLAFTLIHCFILISLAMSVYYVSDRHMMILVLFGSYFAVFGLQELPRRVLGWLNIAAPTDAQVFALKTWWRSAPAWSFILFVALLGFCVPKGIQRLHGSRVGNHLAGDWLAQHIQPGDVIEDDHYWSHYFTGLLFEEDHIPKYPKDLKAKCYVVVTCNREAAIEKRRQEGVLEKDAQLMYVWPENSDVDRARIVIFAQPRTREKHPWHILPD